jgi:hypothetical protein
MVELDIRNSRMKDFDDIWFMANTWDFDQGSLRTAIVSSFARRGMAIPSDGSLALTEEFLSDPQKAKQWKAFLGRLDPRGRSRTFSFGSGRHVASIPHALPLAANEFCVGPLDAERRLERPRTRK